MSKRTDVVRQQLDKIIKGIPGISATVSIEGLSILDLTTKSNVLTMFLPLKTFGERKGHPDQTALAIVRKLQIATSQIQDAMVLAIEPPAVQSLGNAGGFQLEIEDRQNAGLTALQQATDAVVAAASKDPRFQGVLSSFRAQVPQLYLSIDRAKVTPCSAVMRSSSASCGNWFIALNHRLLKSTPSKSRWNRCSSS